MADTSLTVTVKVWDGRSSTRGVDSIFTESLQMLAQQTTSLE